MKEELRDSAFQKFDDCVQRYANKIKNCLDGMIYHAYNVGKKEGWHDKLINDRDAWNAAYRKGTEDMLDAVRDFLLTSEERPSSFEYDEIRKVMTLSDNVTLDILNHDAESLMEKARVIHQNREVDAFLKEEKLKECDTVEYALDVLRKHGWKKEKMPCEACPLLHSKEVIAN